MQIKLKSNGAVSKAMQARADKWATSGPMAARVRVPESLKWWLWQENGTPPRVISAVEAKLLAFPGEGGGTELRESVDHPGVRAHHTVANTMPEITDNTCKLVQEAMADGGANDPGKVRAAVLEAAEDAIDKIADAMAIDLPGTRPDNPIYPKQSGKLHGETAASVFRSEAVPVEVE